MLKVVTIAAARASWLLAAAAAIDGVSATAHSTSDIRAPLERVAFGSCNDQSKEQPLWSSILSRDPQLWLWMGDNIYGDYKEMYELKSYVPPFQFFREAPPTMLQDKYALQLAHPAYAELQSRVPVIGIWDDHDFGRNDGDRTYSYRAQSQSLFLDFVNEPEDSPRRRQEGVYASYTVGSGERTVKFILLDVRYHKDPYDTVDGDFLGPAQWQWLERELATTDAAFNVIVSGVQVLPTGRFVGGEQWHRFALQRERLLNTLLQSSARGVVLLSGDVHFAEINQVQCHDYRNLITEVTSSGLTHSVDVGRNRLTGFLARTVFSLAAWVLPWEFRPQRAQYYGGLNAGELTFHWDALPAPTATARVYDVDGNVQLAYTFASQFYFAGDRTATSADTTTAATSPAQTCKPIRPEMRLLVLARRVVFACTLCLLLAALPMSCALAFGALYVASRRSLAFMLAQQRELFDMRYEKIERAGVELTHSVLLYLRVANTKQRPIDLMGVRRALFVAAALSAVAFASVRGELNACLGVEMTRLHAIPTCSTLYTACEVGVSMLNQQLHVTEDERFSPVSVVSASQSHVNGSENTLVAMLVQLAPIDECVNAAPAKSSETAAQRSCTFDMTKLEVYSILVTLDMTMRWSLDGYKHHALTESERARIVEQYKIGKFFGSNLAVGIFDAPSLPLESASNAQDKTFVRSTTGIFLVLGSAGLSVGLLFHHRRRLHNGYAPIMILKRGQLQAAAAGAGAATPKPKTKSNASTGTLPELTSLRQSNPVPPNEDTTITHESSERFAV